MRKLLLTAPLALVLSGCVVGQPAPYYGGYPPYYGTAYAPAYVGVGVVAGGYYPYYGHQRIHSGYNNGYWHHQQAAGAARVAPHAGPAHGGEHR